MSSSTTNRMNWESVAMYDQLVIRYPLPIASDNGFNVIVKDWGFITSDRKYKCLIGVQYYLYLNVKDIPKSNLRDIKATLSKKIRRWAKTNKSLLTFDSVSHKDLDIWVADMNNDDDIEETREVKNVRVPTEKVECETDKQRIQRIKQINKLIADLTKEKQQHVFALQEPMEYNDFDITTELISDKLKMEEESFQYRINKMREIIDDGDKESRLELLRNDPPSTQHFKFPKSEWDGEVEDLQDSLGHLVN